MYINWDKLKGIFTGISYFANGAIGGAIGAATLSIQAGAAATMSLNIGTDIVTQPWFVSSQNY